MKNPMQSDSQHKVLYLYAEIMGYTLAVIDAASELGADFHVVHWDKKKLTPYEIETSSKINFYPRSEFTTSRLIELVIDLNPNIVVVSGWMDLAYLKVAAILRRRNCTVVLALDSHWKGTWKQFIATVLAKLGLRSYLYSHAWVPGICQYEFARKLGFSKDRILYDLYSADLNLFHQSFKSSLSRNTNIYPHVFTFVGRLEPVKGLKTLLDAWLLLDDCRGDWRLKLIGSGSMKIDFSKIPGVTVEEFKNPKELAEEAKSVGCFVLPSIDEPWGVVVHEFAAVGVPLILSDKVGSANTFLIEKYNGYVFKVGDPQDLCNKLLQIINTKNRELIKMGVASHKLSYRISPVTSAMNLLKIR